MATPSGTSLAPAGNGEAVGWIVAELDLGADFGATRGADPGFALGPASEDDGGTDIGRLGF
jgi:hypothetical protein